MLNQLICSVQLICSIQLTSTKLHCALPLSGALGADLPSPNVPHERHKAMVEDLLNFSFGFGQVHWPGSPVIVKNPLNHFHQPPYFSSGQKAPPHPYKAFLEMRTPSWSHSVGWSCKCTFLCNKLCSNSPQLKLHGGKGPGRSTSLKECWVNDSSICHFSFEEQQYGRMVRWGWLIDPTREGQTEVWIHT